ncbi:MAG: AAA family ATPase [Bacteroidetes bacterium]|nr:AAA family ATPase [Bacteroidota bacterium]
MTDAFANKIKRLELENFTCFGKVEMDFSPGINVFIGENGTGKTHLLKVLYLSTNQRILERVDEQYESKIPELKAELASPDSFIDYHFNISETLVKHYYPSTITEPGQLIKKEATSNDLNDSATIKTTINQRTLKLNIGRSRYEFRPVDEDFGFKHQSVFIPSQEMISWFEGFADLYENYVNAFDPTYFFLSKSLSRPIPKGKKAEKANQLISEIEDAVHIQVQFDGRKFIIYSNPSNGNGGEGFEAPLVATGINKLAQLIQLTMNGAIHPGSILIWDEPEAGLNPKYIKPVAQFLLTLANAGCQIFIATHDYLLPYELSLSVEYAYAMKKEKQQVPPMKFFTLMKGENGTVVESGETMYDLPYDAIMEGHLQFHEKREQLQRDSLKQ